jgi:hypothetical protein
VLGPLTKVTRTLRLRDRTNPDPSTEPHRRDFPLKLEVLSLLMQIRAMRHGTLERVEVLHGLPTVAEVSEPLPPATGPRGTSTPPPGR